MPSENHQRARLAVNIMVPFDYSVGPHQHTPINRFLVLKRNEQSQDGGQWVVPSGCVDNYEQIAAAAARKLVEQTGIVCGCTNLVFESLVHVYHSEHIQYVHTFWLCTRGVPSGPTYNAQPDKHDEFRWVTKREFDKLPSPDFVREGVDLVFRADGQDAYGAIGWPKAYGKQLGLSIL